MSSLIEVETLAAKRFAEPTAALVVAHIEALPKTRASWLLS